MGFYFHRIPTIVQKFFPKHLWRIPDSNLVLYLTFDDGPTSKSTDFILNTLNEYQAKATFFCLGKQVKTHPDLVQKIQLAEHRIANHGYEHLDGWKISKSEYLQNVKKGEQVLVKSIGDQNMLFRPPYGHFRSRQAVVLWTLMSGDFDPDLPKEKCLSILKSRIRPGDIIVFHDNAKSYDKLSWVLPRFFTYCREKGFRFEVIPSSK